ncbi:hypothetical protein, partial [Xanthomonas citri]
TKRLISQEEMWGNLRVRGRSTRRALCRRHCISALLLLSFKPCFLDIFDFEGAKIFKPAQT